MERRKLWKDEKQELTFCHTKTIMKMWRNKNRYGEDRKTKVGKCKKESIEYPGGRFYVEAYLRLCRKAQNDCDRSCPAGTGKNFEQT